jgi:hypothetical protein
MVGFLRVAVRNPTFVNEGQNEAAKKKKNKTKKKKRTKRENTCLHDLKRFHSTKRASVSLASINDTPP